ncbi:hypothetical protein JXD38_03565 [candidate division WOR-3 bacterium]|nr:hypothetical protein [candidate division WOR-3 bacterium]
MIEAQRAEIEMTGRWKTVWRGPRAGAGRQRVPPAPESDVPRLLHCDRIAGLLPG